jgi:hypothetical protein
VSCYLDVLFRLLTSLSDTGSVASTSTRHLSLQQVQASFLRRPIGFINSVCPELLYDATPVLYCLDYVLDIRDGEVAV